MAWNVEDTDYVLKQISLGGYDAEKIYMIIIKTKDMVCGNMMKRVIL